MNRIRTYRVAEHCFRLCFPDIDKLWGSFESQYEPFLTDEDIPEKDLLFSLEMADEIKADDRTCIYDAPTEDGETVVKLYSTSDGWIFETFQDKHHPLCATIWSDKNFKHCKICLHTRLVRDASFGINNATMLMFAFASAGMNTLELHSSVIENEGKAYLFLGKSGTGKSTHSSLWLKHIPGSELMNDDNPALRIWPDGRIIIYGTPWSGKTPCYKNVEAPAGAFVQIRQSPENKIRKMSVLESFTSLFSSISGLKDDESEMSDRINDSMDKVISSVPFFLLDCRPDKEAAELSASTVRV